MNEEYLKGLYEHFGGQAKLGGTFEEWSSGISSNDDYKKGMFETLGGADKMGGSYDEWNTSIFGVKKKVGEEVSESSEEPTTTGDFEQWELDLFKQFDENPKSLSTASSVDLRKYNDYKKSIGEDMSISSTPNQEFLSEQGVADRAEEERAAREDYPLSFQEEERKPVNYFSLFDKKDLVDQANKQGVSVSFVEEASQAAANAEYPLAFLAKRKNIRDRIKKLPEYAPNATTEIQALSNVDIDSRNIDDVEFQLSQIENRHLDPLGTVVSTEGRPMEINPTRSTYEREVKENPAGIAIEQLQRDNEKLRRAASLPKSTEKEDLETEIAKKYTAEELDMFDEFDKNPNRLRGANEELSGKYADFKAEVASGMTVQDVINARKNIFKGAASGLGQYVSDYATLIDQLVGNNAVVELQDKLSRIERGENIELTTDDKLLMRAIIDNAKLHEELDGEIPTAYKIGESLGNSIGFMLEFGFSGGGAQAIGKGVAKSVAKRGLREVGEIAAKRGAVGKFGIGTAIKLTQAGIQTAKMPAFYKQTALNVSNGQNFGEAALNAYWETGVESLSERIFMSSPVGGVAGKGATDLLRRAGINFNVDKGAVGVFKNVLEEAAEEKIGEIMTAPKDYETFSEFWKAFTDREQNAVMLGSVALMTGGMGSVALTGNKFSETQRKARVKRIEKHIPSDLRAEIDVITSNVDLSLDQQYALIKDAISSRIETQELGEDPATTTANAMQYAQYRVQEQAANTTDENAVVENGEITVGEVEPVGTMQDQLDYLNERGVDANGLNAEQVEKLYDKTKSEEDKEAIDEATGEVGQEESPTAQEEAFSVETLEPQKPIAQMDGEELRSFADEIKQYESNLYDVIFGDMVKEVKQLEISSESIDVNRARKAADKLYQIISSLPKAKQDLLYSEQKYNRGDIVDIARNVESVESSENVGELASAIKKPMLNLVRNNTDEGSLAVLNAARQRAEQLDIPVESLLNTFSRIISRDVRDVDDAMLVVKGALQSIATTSYTKQQKAVEPRVTNLKEETKDDEKVQEQQVQEQDEQRQDEKPTEEVEVSEAGAAQSQEDVVQEVEEFKPFADIVRESETVDEAFQKAGEIKDVPAETSQMFREQYDPEQKLTPKQAFEKFYNEIKATEQPQTPTEAKTEQKGAIAPSEEKVAEKAPKPTPAEEQKVEQATGIKPKNLRDVYKAGREVFGLNRSQALAQAVVVDRVIGKIAKRRGVSKGKIYSTVEFKKSQLEDLTPQARNLYQAVWHGSPHAFEKFTTEKIGTGEGAQAFGWGLYFTDKKNIAEHYAKNIGKKELLINGNPVDIKTIKNTYLQGMLNSLSFGISKKFVMDVEERRYKTNKNPDIQKALDFFNNNDITIKESGKNLYKVKLHGDRAIDDFNYLRWDKDITEAEEKRILDTLPKKQRDYMNSMKSVIGIDKWNGGDFYSYLRAATGNQRDASMALLNAGIDGIKYPTEITRKGAHEESFNYVIFDENIAEIEEHIKFQQGQGAKGAIQFLEDGNAIIHALTDPNVSTPLHEIAHLYEKYMTKSERDAVLRWAKQKEWNVDTSEKFARGFEKYLAEGVAPNEALKRVFDRFKEWLTDIYNGITGSEIDIELNDEMRSVYNAMLGEGTVRPKQAKKVEYKKEFKDVDDLLFQDGTLYQGEDKTERHTTAVNTLIDNFEQENVKNMEQSVRDYLEERGNPVSEQIINNVLKERGYAKGYEGAQVRAESKQKEKQGQRDSDMPKGDRSKLQDGKKTKKEEVGYKSSRLGVRYAFGEGFTEEAKEAYRNNQLHKYKPESQEEVVAVAEVVFNTNDDAAIERIVRGKETPRRVRQVLGVMLGNKYSQDAENALREGNTELGDQMIDAEQQIMKEVQRMATDSGRDVAIFNSEFIMDMLTPYKTARMVERSMSDHADEVRKSHGYKKTKEIVQDELEKLRPSVMKAVGKDKRVQQAKKKAKRQTDPRKEKIRKEISDLTDMLRATKGSSASVSIIGLSNEQIEIGGKIAVKYLELGIVNVQELIQRLKKEFNKAGIEITEDEARQMIPERDGKTVEELEKEQALEAAAEKLAQEEFGYVADKRAPKTDPIAQMVRTLTSKFRERAKEGERPAPRSNMDVIKEAILNKTDYMEVWNEARQSAMDLIDKMVADEKITEAQAEVYKQRVEDSYQRATTFSVSESRIQQLIRESLKERDISIDDVVRDHYERRELHKQELIGDLVEKSGLTNEAAKELADVIDNAFQTLMIQKGEALIKKYLKKKDVKPKKQGAKSPIAELIELINIGALNNPEFDAIFDEMYGVPQLTDRQRNEIIRRGKKIQKIKAADVRHKAEQDLMAYVMDLEGINGAEVLTAFWYAHVLSGVPTHIRNISDAYVSSYLETLNLAGFDVRAIRGMIKAHRRGMKYEGRQRLIETMTTGFTPLAKKLEIPSALERITFEPKGDKRDVKLIAKTAEIYRKIFRYVPRFLSATDAYIYAGAKEASAYIVKFRREVQRLEDEKGRKLNRSERKALHKHMNELLYVDKATVERIRAEVEQESEDYKQIQRDFGEEPTGYNQREKYLREFELIDQERGLDVTDTAFDIAGRAIGNIKSYGVLGQVVDGVARFLRSFGKFSIGKPNVTMRRGRPIVTFDQTKQVTVSPFGLVIPFTRIVANVATRNLGWNMYVGAIRAATGRLTVGIGKDSQYYMEMSPEEKKVAWQKVLKIGIIHSMLFMLTQPDDDGDSFITITFDGTGNYEKNKQLEESGWKPYSIQIGDVSISYLTLGGLAMLFAPIGYIRDKQKYTDTDNSVLELYAMANVMSIGHVIKSTPVYAINKVFELINKMMTGDEEQFFKKLSQTAGSMATGFVSPKAVSDIINLMGVISQNPREKPETALARALQYVPLVDLDEGRIHYDVFGEAVPKNMSLSQIVEKVKRDDNVQYYIEQGYFRPSLSIHQTKFEIADDRDNRVSRPLNPKRKLEVELFNRYESTVGRRFKEEVMSLREDGVEGEEFVNEMESRWREIVKDAKADVYSETRDRPLKYDKDAEIKE